MLKKYELFISVIVIFFKIYNGNAARAHKLSMQFQRVECGIYNKEFVQSLNCSLRRSDVTKELLFNADFILIKDVYDVKMRTKVTYEVNGYSVNLFEAEVDVCKLLTQRPDLYFLRMINDELHRRSNAPYFCPIRRNISYFMHKFTINSKYFPAFLPESKWSAYFNFSSENRVTVDLRLWND